MARFVMRVYDEGAGELLRAYSVTVAEGKASARPFRKEWAGTARRVEDALNRGCLAGDRVPPEALAEEARVR